MTGPCRCQDIIITNIIDHTNRTSSLNSQVSLFQWKLILVFCASQLPQSTFLLTLII